jgi:hypothetical protein
VRKPCPISFYELVCHLGPIDFLRSKANVLKLSVCQVLDDPLAELAEDLGCPQAANSSRFEDRRAIPLLLPELQQASMYQDFCRRSVLVDATSRSVGDIASSAEAYLSAQEVAFVERVGNTRDGIRRLYTRGDRLELSGLEFCRESTRLARGLVQDFSTVGCQVRFAEAADRTLLGAGYAVARALRYARLSDDAMIDGNDLEDFFLCLHLGVTSGRVMVTNDSGTRDAIRFVLDEFRQSASQIGHDFRTNVGIISRDDFRSETRPHTTA